GGISTSEPYPTLLYLSFFLFLPTGYSGLSCARSLIRKGFLYSRFFIRKAVQERKDKKDRYNGHQ
ncbi:hypothetical protein AB4424_24310, partial [Vibrio splendidus]